MRKSIYLLKTTPSSHTHRFHPLPLTTPTSCSPHPLATPIHSTHSPQLSSILLTCAQVCVYTALKNYYIVRITLRTIHVFISEFSFRRYLKERKKMPPQCCRCNGKGRCVGCSCVRRGVSCTNCTPCHNGRCENYGAAPVCQASGANQPEPQPSKEPSPLADASEHVARMTAGSWRVEPDAALDNHLLAKECAMRMPPTQGRIQGGGYGGSSPPLPESGRVYSVRTRSVT